MATRPRKKPASNSNSLLLALEFVANAQKNIGTQLQTHCIVKDGWCVASDNVLTMGCKVPDDLTACPQTARLIAALRRCADTVSLTQLDADRISVKSGPIRVVVPCVALDGMQVVWADPMIAPLGAAFLDACKAIQHLAADGGTAVHLASLLGRGQTLSATTGRVLVEYWHGFETPPYWVLPKPAVSALLRVTKPLIGFGYSGRSATFYFDDSSWLRTQLYEDKWPNVDALFSTESARTPVIETLFAAIDVMAEFAAPGAHARFKDDMIELIAPQAEAAEHEVKGLRAGARFGVKDLQQISKICKTLDYKQGDKAALFTSQGLRGAISLIHDAAFDVGKYDDDIPF